MSEKQTFTPELKTFSPLPVGEESTIFSLEDEGRLDKNSNIPEELLKQPYFVRLDGKGELNLQVLPLHNRTAYSPENHQITIVSEEISTVIQRLIEENGLGTPKIRSMRMKVEDDLEEQDEEDDEQEEPGQVMINNMFRLGYKGAGFIYPENFESKKDNYQRGHFADLNKEITTANATEYPWQYQILGLFDSDVLPILLDNSALLSREGARCEDIVKAFQLEHIYYNNKLTQVAELKEKEILPDDFDPVCVERACRIPYRIKDFRLCRDRDIKIDMLKQAFEVLNQENGLLNIDYQYDINTIKSVKKYCSDFAYQVGRNLGTMQRLGKLMSFFNSGNITLGLGEIVDLDSIHDYDSKSEGQNMSEEYNIPKAILADIRDCVVALKLYFKDLKKLFPALKNEQFRQHTCEAFLQGHQDFYAPNEQLEKAYQNNLQEKVKDCAKRSLLKGWAFPRIKFNRTNHIPSSRQQ